MNVVPVHRCAIALLVLLSLAGATFGQSKPPAPIPDATEYRNVRYLPQWRYPEESEERRTDQMGMDVVIPEDDKNRHPAMFVVHGGGWGGGTKDQSIYRKIMAYFVERGYVAVGFNYILRPRGIMPQVFWDTETAIRFLRQNAEKYEIDPTRIGAIGISAGGWLISSIGHGSGDLFIRNHQQSRHVGELWERGWRSPDDDWNESFLRPIANPNPVYPNEYGRFQAISMDFHFRIQYGSGNSPAMNNWMGQGGRMHDHQEAAAKGGKFDYSETQWTHPKFRGKGLHCPPLFKSVRNQGNEAVAIGFDGQTSEEGIEQVHRFFQHHFYENPRTPVPAFRPTTRFFDREVAVRFVMPDMESSLEIRYQVLPLKRVKGKRWDEGIPRVQGNEWTRWNRYERPFTLTEHSLVRAVATCDGRRPSTIAEAHFFEGVADAPRITAPQGDQLPPGKTGEAYEVTFKSNVEKPRWFLAGDLVPWSRKGQHYPNNMLLDRQTGIWSGTPTKPGRYWVQIWLNEADGAVAGYRDYCWMVEGEDLSDGEDLFKTAPVDPYIELVCVHDSNIRASRLSAPLRQHGIRHEFQDDKNGTMILVQKRDAAEARRIIEQKLKDWKHRGELRWQ